jgi:hypothetical protein
MFLGMRCIFLSNFSLLRSNYFNQKHLSMSCKSWKSMTRFLMKEMGLNYNIKLNHYFLYVTEHFENVFHTRRYVDVDWRGFGGRDLIPTHRKFPEGARQHSHYPHACAFDNGSEIGKKDGLGGRGRDRSADHAKSSGRPPPCRTRDL